MVLGLSAIATAQLPTPDPEIAADKAGADHYPAAQVNFQNGVTSIPGLTYWEPVGYRRLTLDLYLPPSSVPRPSEGFPLVVYIHGGGWRGATRIAAYRSSIFPAYLLHSLREATWWPLSSIA